MMATKSDTNDIFTKEHRLLDNDPSVNIRPSLVKLSMAVIPTMLLQISVGLTFGYSAVLLPQLTDPLSSLKVDGETASWIAAMSVIPMALGCPLSGYMMERFGRQSTLLILSLPYAIGWIFIAWTESVHSIMVGRLVTGICTGMVTPVAVIYIGEISNPDQRAIFLILIPLFGFFGLFLVHLLGTFLHWQLTALISAVFTFIAYIFITFAPESPNWLISKGRIEEGVVAFTWLRESNLASASELKRLVDQQALAEKGPSSWKKYFKELKSPRLLKPLGMTVFYFMIVQLSGANAIAFYSVAIMQSVLKGSMDGYIATITIDVVRVVMCMTTVFLVRRFNRRPLVILSGSMSALFLFGLSVYLYSSRLEVESHSVWIPLLLVSIYIFASNAVFAPLAWAVCGEVFPERMRGLGSGIGSFVVYASVFVVVKTLPTMMDAWSDFGTFFAYGCVASVGTFVLFIILPETRGKSLQEIEDLFKTK